MPDDPQENEDEWEELNEFGETNAETMNREMMDQVRRKAARGDAICGALLDLEHQAKDYYLGQDEEYDIEEF